MGQGDSPGASPSLGQKEQWEGDDLVLGVICSPLPSPAHPRRVLGSAQLQDQLGTITLGGIAGIGCRSKPTAPSPAPQPHPGSVAVLSHSLAGQESVLGWPEGWQGQQVSDDPG